MSIILINLVNVLPEKPNYTVPRSNPDLEMMSNAKKELNALCNVKNSEKSSNEISNLPITGNQVYGFFHKEKVIILF